jgi:hypothetical protein
MDASKAAMTIQVALEGPEPTLSEALPPHARLGERKSTIGCPHSMRLTRLWQYSSRACACIVQPSSRGSTAVR